MNSMRAIITFLLIMWVMILLAGVAVIYVIGSISVTGYGDIDGLATVALKGLGAIALIIAWIFVLGKPCIQIMLQDATVFLPIVLQF